MNLTIVHPCYNPQSLWAEELAFYYKAFLAGLPSDTNVAVIVVNDGSSKGIEASAIEYLKSQISDFQMINCEKNQGKGAALRVAVQETKTEIVIYTDADYPYQMENAWDMFECLASGKYDIVVGVRDDHYYEQLPRIRKVFSLSLKYMNYFFFPKLFVKDTQSGLKGFNLKGKEVFLQTKINAFLFDMEFLWLASKRSDLRLKAIPVQVREGITFSKMSWKTIIKELLNFSKILTQ